MWLIDKLRKLFNSDIALEDKDRLNLISFVDLRHNALKTGTSVKVEDNYKLIFVKDNKVFDILEPGTYKIDEKIAPKIYIDYFRSVKNQKGMEIKSIVTDLYYLNMSETLTLEYKTFDKIFAPCEGRDIRFNLKGQLKFKVDNAEVFMKYFSEEFAKIKNKKLINEILDLFCFELSKILNLRRFAFKDFSISRDKIREFVLDNMDIMTTYGIKITEFLVEDLIVSKKDLGVKLINQIEETSSNEVIKQAEDQLNRINVDEFIYAGGREKDPKKTETSESTEFPNESIRDNVEKVIPVMPINNNLSAEGDSSVEEMLTNSMYDRDREAQLFENQPAPQIIELGTSSLNESDLGKNGNHFNDEEKVKKVSNQNRHDSNQKDNNVSTMGEGRVSKKNKTNMITNKNNTDLKAGQKEKLLKNQQKSDNQNQQLQSEDSAERIKKVINGEIKAELTSCPCCGAKNFADAKECCVCKSKLN